jgi:hypothetical protein
VWVYAEDCGGFMGSFTGGGDGTAIRSFQEGFGLHSSDEQQPKRTGKPTNPTNRPRFMYISRQKRLKSSTGYSCPRWPPTVEIIGIVGKERKGITCRDVSSKRGNGCGA